MEASKIKTQLSNIESILADREMVKSLEPSMVLHLVEKRDALKIQLNSK